MIPPDIAQHALERGVRARALLQSDVFVEAMRDLEFHHTTALVSAMPTPAERDARDYHHGQIHSLRELVSTLMGYVQAADEIEESLAEEAEDDIEE